MSSSNTPASAASLPSGAFSFRMPAGLPTPAAQTPAPTPAPAKDQKREKEYAWLKETTAEKLRENIVLNDQHLKLRIELNKLKEEHQAVKKDLAEHVVENDKLGDQNDEVWGKCERLEAELERVKKDAASTANDETDNTKLRRDLSAAKEKAANMDDINQRYYDDIRKLQEENDELMATVRKAEAEKKQLSDQISTRDVELTQHQKEVAARDEEIDRYRGLLAKRDEKLEEEKGIFRELEDHVKKLDADLQSANDDLQGAYQDAKQWQTRYAESQMMLDDLRAEWEENQSEVHELKETVAAVPELERQLTELEKELEIARAGKEETDQALAVRDSRIASYERDLQKGMQEAQRLREQLLDHQATANGNLNESIPEEVPAAFAAESLAQELEGLEDLSNSEGGDSEDEGEPHVLGFSDIKAIIDIPEEPPVPAQLGLSETMELLDLAPSTPPRLSFFQREGVETRPLDAAVAPLSLVMGNGVATQPLIPERPVCSLDVRVSAATEPMEARPDLASVVQATVETVPIEPVARPVVAVASTGTQTAGLVWDVPSLDAATQTVPTGAVKPAEALERATWAGSVLKYLGPILAALFLFVFVVHLWELQAWAAANRSTTYYARRELPSSFGAYGSPRTVLRVVPVARDLGTNYLAENVSRVTGSVIHIVEDWFTRNRIMPS